MLHLRGEKPQEQPFYDNERNNLLMYNGEIFSTTHADFDTTNKNDGLQLYDLLSLKTDHVEIFE